MLCRFTCAVTGFAFFSCQNQLFEDMSFESPAGCVFSLSDSLGRFSLVKHTCRHTTRPSAVLIRSGIIPAQMTTIKSLWFGICFPHQKVFVILQLCCFVLVQMYITSHRQASNFAKYYWYFNEVSYLYIEHGILIHAYIPAYEIWSTVFYYVTAHNLPLCKTA